MMLWLRKGVSIMSVKKKFISLCSLLLVLIAILAIMFEIASHSTNSTSTRYIQREKDEVKAYYSSLYFDGTGEKQGITIENNIGYVSFDLRNYIGEDVTKRDIEYQIETVSQFYDYSGEVLTNPDGTQDLYVLDLWDEPKKIENDTCKYNVSVDTNSGEKTSEGNYLFKYEERGASAVGKTHKVTLKLERKDIFSDITHVEKISIVVQIIKPYKTIYIINMYVTNRLILFSDMDINVLETSFKSLQIQTADRFLYTKNTISKQTSKAFKVTLTWNGLILNENMLKNIHNNVFDLLGTTDATNLNISKPYIVQLNQDTDFGELVIYIPPSANFSLNFLPTSNEFKVIAKVEIYCDDQYEYYTQTTFGGYELDESGEMLVMKS